MFIYLLWDLLVVDGFVECICDVWCVECVLFMGIVFVRGLSLVFGCDISI